MEGIPKTIYFVGRPDTGNEVVRACANFRCRVRCFASPADFLEVAPTLDLACLVADMDSVDFPTSKFLAKLETCGVALPTILIGNCAPPQSLSASGVIGVVPKPLTAGRLLESLRQAQPLLVARQRDELDQAKVARLQSLTQRERDVLSGLVGGMSNKAIASSLKTDLRSIELCRIGLMKTLGVTTFSQLILYGLAGGVRILR